MNATATHTFRMSAGIARERGLHSREVEVLDVLNETPRAYRLRVHAVVRASDHCLNCGREIDNPVSRLAGYGPYCSENLGIPRTFTEEQIEAIRESVKVTTTIEAWFPKSVVGHLGTETMEHTSLRVEQAAAPAPTFTVEMDGGQLIVRTPHSVAAKVALKGVTGARWNPTVKTWCYPGAPRTVAALVAVAGLLEMQPELDAGSTTLLAELDVENAAQVLKDASELPPIPTSATDAWHHQRQAYWFTEGLRGAMLAMDMGTGKSKVAVDLVVNRAHQRTLIVCPKSVVGVWPKQFAIHAGTDVRVVAPSKGPKGGPLTVAKRVGQIKAALDLANVMESPLVVVVNYESAWQPGMAELLLGTAWDCVILDESHRIKKPGGKASQFCGTLGRRAAYRLALTGTPMPHSPLDVYAQYRFVDPSVFGTSFARFRARYAVMGGWQDKVVVDFKNQSDLAERMYRVAFRVEAGDVLDLPPVLHEQRTFTLGAKAAKVYADLDAELVADVAEGTVTAANGLVRLLREQQVTSGRVPVEDEHGTESYVEVDTGKRDLLADTIEDLATTEPIVVFCRFTQDLDNVAHVAEKQGRRYGELSGRRRDGLAEDSTMATDIDVLGVQVQSGGVGIDLTRARYGVYYSVGFSLGDYEQSLARLHRPGQDRHVVYFHLVAEGTVDEKVYVALQERRDVVRHVLELSR